MRSILFQQHDKPNAFSFYFARQVAPPHGTKMKHWSWQAPVLAMFVLFTISFSILFILLATKWLATAHSRPFIHFLPFFLSFSGFSVYSFVPATYSVQTSIWIIFVSHACQVLFRLAGVWHVGFPFFSPFLFFSPMHLLSAQSLSVSPLFVLFSSVICTSSLCAFSQVCLLLVRTWHCCTSFVRRYRVQFPLFVRWRHCGPE